MSGGALLVGSIRVSHDTWFDVVAHEAPPRGTYWDPEDGPRPVNGVEVCLFAEVPVCSCKGHNTCDDCAVRSEEVIAGRRQRGEHRAAWSAILAHLHADPDYAPLFSGGGRLVARFKGGRLVRVRRVERRRARYVPLHVAIFGG